MNPTSCIPPTSQNSVTFIKVFVALIDWELMIMIRASDTDIYFTTELWGLNDKNKANTNVVFSEDVLMDLCFSQEQERWSMYNKRAFIKCLHNSKTDWNVNICRKHSLIVMLFIQCNYVYLQWNSIRTYSLLLHTSGIGGCCVHLHGSFLSTLLTLCCLDLFLGVRLTFQQ